MIDADVKAVVEFMQREIPAARLVGVAAGINALAPLLWGRYKAEAVYLLSLLECGSPSGAVTVAAGDVTKAWRQDLYSGVFFEDEAQT